MSDEFLETARAASRAAPPIGATAYVDFVNAVRAGLIREWPRLAAASTADQEAGRQRGLPEPLLRRIVLTDAHRDRLLALTDAVPAELRAAAKPGRRYQGRGGSVAWQEPRPLGVLLMIYEARPTVTVDSAVLGVCAGNAVLLRGGTEINGTNAVLAEILATALAEAGLPAGLVQVLRELDRAGLRELLRRDDAIDVLLPRGSPSLLDSCRAISRIPMIVGGGGVNHEYVHAEADLDLAVRIVLDGAVPEPEGCTALEAVLLDEAIAEPFCHALAARADEPDVKALTLRLAPELPADALGDLTVEPLAPTDLGREFLAPTLAVSPVSGVSAAVRHIRRYGSGHTEGIVTEDAAAAAEFCRGVDAAAVVVNGSIRLHDGPTLGLGSEIAISTGRLHVRGPVTLADLMSHSWRVDGNRALRFTTR